MAEDLAATMARQLRVRGGSLGEVAARAGRRLPRHLKTDVDAIIEAEALSENPKLAHRVDAGRLKKADRRIRSFLDKQDPKAERRAEFLDQLAGVVFILFSVLLAAFFVALSQGYLG